MSKILIELKGKVSKIFTSITHMNPYTKGFLDGIFMIIAIVCICRMPIINIKDSGYSFSNVDRIINVIGYIILLRLYYTLEVSYTRILFVFCKRQYYNRF